MAPPSQCISIDKEDFTVLAYRTEHDTVFGTVWRFILADNVTIVVTPYQLETHPAKQLACMPQAIESTLEGVFSYIVGAATLIDPRDTRGSNGKPDDIKEGSRQSYGEYLAALREYLDAFDVVLDGKGAGDLYDYIRSHLARRSPPDPTIRHQDLNLIVQAIFSRTGTHVGERVALDYSPEMPSIVEYWAQKLFLSKKTPISLARKQVLADSPFVARFMEEEFYTARPDEHASDEASGSSTVVPMRTLVLIRSITQSTHDAADRKELIPKSVGGADEFPAEDYVDGTTIQDKVFGGSRREWDRYRPQIAAVVPTLPKGGKGKRIYYHLPSCVQWVANNLVKQPRLDGGTKLSLKKDPNDLSGNIGRGSAPSL